MKCSTLISLLFPAVLMLGCGPGKAEQAAAAGDAAADSLTAAPFSADSAYAYIERQLAFGPRVPGSEGHKACAIWLENEMKRHGADTVTVQRATVQRHDGVSIPIANIMARFNPDAGKRVLLAAHWDTRPWADEENDASLHSRPIPGANDGGSGTAVLLELARQFGLQRPEIGVDLLLVDAEDSGVSGSDDPDDGSSSWCLGTQYWVDYHPYTAATLPQYAIVLDMVGGTGARFHREAVSQYAVPSVVNKVWGLAARLGHGDTFVNETGGSVLDDHVFIMRAGIPAIDIIENSNQATGSFAPSWHTMADDISAIDRRPLRAAGETVATLIYSEKQ